MLLSDIESGKMAGLAQFAFSTKHLLACFAFWSPHAPASSSGMLALLMILLLFVLFLVPFDRRIIDLHARWATALRDRTSGKPTDRGTSKKTIAGGPYTRQLCNMLDLEVVVLRNARSSHVGSFLGRLAIGRWNEEARKFEVVTAWCDTWAELEKEARHAMKSFRGVAYPSRRGAPHVEPH